jgi:hypothetical protein
MAFLMGEFFCGVALLGRSSLLDTNQERMEVEIKILQNYCYKKLSFSMFFLWVCAYVFWGL